MSHLDEGTLHALLDGELDLHEVREIQAHLGSCTACDSRFQAAKDVYGEADRLVGSVQYPGGMKGMREPEAAHAAPAPPPASQPAPGAKQRRIEAKPVSHVGVPQVVILPEQNDWPDRRRRWVGMAKWAAVFCVAVGAGFLASEARKNAEPGSLTSIRAADSDEPNWVVSQDEMSGVDSLPASITARRLSPTMTAGGETALAKPATPAPKKPDPKPAPTAAAGAQSGARETTLAKVTNEDKASVAERQVQEEPLAEGEDFAAGVQSQENVRAEAAEALAELDAQRRRDRAAAATAALDRSRRDAPRPSASANVVQPAAAAPPPPPPTLEQRSGIYLRIGLDEAARQLGRPVHVIEGLGAQFMGLVQGSQSPGADDNRPAVRVVYQDTQGRMILLDQQRIRPGQSWPSGPTQWAAGEIGLVLHGEPNSEVLRNLRPRVR